ncbi:hypothetical protein SADUNF_Sadunf01G0147700 [Salix dunnii]|uniref:Uncharacterized protein n=1 Tax=Salix dunnii TaxID=1413687 RepID=A0A835TNP1_9ROSI|nr:hypothetical protein SADUNF_Sadunf01G0147700 [Salix dunnii]
MVHKAQDLWIPFLASMASWLRADTIILPGRQQAANKTSAWLLLRIAVPWNSHSSSSRLRRLGFSCAQLPNTHEKLSLSSFFEGTEEQSPSSCLLEVRGVRIHDHNPSNVQVKVHLLKSRADTLSAMSIHSDTIPAMPQQIYTDA